MSIRAEIFNALNKNYEYAVLRNYEELPDSTSTRDIDLIIREEDYQKIERDVVNIVHTCRYYLLLRFQSERFNTLIFGNAESRDIIQLDFFFHTSARGIIMITADELLNSRQFNGSVYHVSKKYQFLDKFLFNSAVGKSYPSKYGALKKWVEQDEETLSFLRERVRCNSIEEVENLSAHEFRHRMLKYSFKYNKFVQVKNLLKFIYSNIHNFLFSQGFCIGITGPDGVGKTTIMDSVKETLEKVVSGVTQFHFRPNIFDNLGDTMHIIGLNKEVDHDYSNPHRGKETSRIGSLGRLAYYTLDYVFGYLIKIKPLLYRRAIVIFDRYFTDVIVDAKRSKVNLGVKFLYAYSHLIPKLRYNILLVADVEKIISRKQELDRDSIEEIIDNMKMISKKRGYYLLYNNSTPEVAVTEILDIVFINQDKRYRL